MITGELVALAEPRVTDATRKSLEGAIVILLATSNKSFVAIDLDNRLYKTIDSGRGLYYGIAYSDDEIYVAARMNADRYGGTVTERAGERGRILVFDYDLRQVGELHPPFPLRDLHQIFFHRGALHVTCSHDDMIAVFENGTWDAWCPSPDPEDWGRDAHHFNSIWASEDDLFLLAHNNGPSEIWRFRLDDRTLMERVPIGGLAHNVWERDGDLFVCNSRMGAVESVGGTRLRVGGFVRGAVATDDITAIGISGVAERSGRHLVSSYIHIYDKAWEFRECVCLRNEGQLLDIRAPGGRDLAHPGTLGRVPRLSSPCESADIVSVDGSRGPRSVEESKRLFYIVNKPEWYDYRLVSPEDVAGDTELRSGLPDGIPVGDPESPVMGEGWYHREDWPPKVRHTGKRGRLYLRRDDKSGDTLLIRAWCGYPRVADDPIACAIFVNGAEIGTFEFDRHEWMELKVTLPESVLDAPFHDVLIEVDHTWRPGDFHSVVDPRELGLAVEFVGFVGRDGAAQGPGRIQCGSITNPV
jgi:hypothetical protein